MFRIAAFITRLTLVTAYLTTFAIVALTAVYEQRGHWLFISTDYMPPYMRNFILWVVAATAAITIGARAIRKRQIIAR